MGCFLSLELEAYAELGVARVVNGRGDLSESSASQKGIWKAESGSVGEVEELSSNLELHILSDGDFFAERKIGVVNSVGPEIGKVPRRVSSHLVSGCGET